tara:strand:+ start:1252 stop:1767 length:516 start_codon:yes stop_codon:yes gene_type:complete
MTNTRGTGDEKNTRVERAAELLDQSLAIRSEVVKELARKFEVSVQQAREYVREAEKLLAPTFDLKEIRYKWQEIENDLKLCTVRSLEEGNLNAAVGATKARVNHYKQINKIDPSAAWDRELTAAFCDDSYPPNPDKKIPTERLSERTKRKPFIPKTSAREYDINSVDYIPF